MQHYKPTDGSYNRFKQLNEITIMPFNESNIDDKIELLQARGRVLNSALHEVDKCRSALAEIKSLVKTIPDPNPPEGTIGRTIEEKSKPKDELTGDAITDARRNMVYDKRMAEADTLLGQTV